MNDDAQTPGNMGGGPDESATAFDPSLEHHAQPKLRPVQPLPIQHQGQRMLGLRDASMIADRMVVTAPLAQFVLGHMDGTNSIGDIVAKAQDRAKQQNVPAEAVGQITEEPVKMLIGQLDAAGMLEGPVFDGMLAKMREEFDSTDVLPPSTTAEIAEAMAKQDLPEGSEETPSMEAGAEKLAQAIDQMCDKAVEQAQDPSFDALPRAVFVPHIDYQRGWVNYASVYARMRVCDRPDRVLVIAPNAFGRATGVAGCNKGFGSPLGTCPLDQALFDAICNELGAENTERFLRDKYDHEREASIELQVPWLRRIFGGEGTDAGPPVVGVLVHDFLRNSGSALDENGLSLDAFVEAATKAIDSVGGRTLVVCTAALSHVGPGFGDPQDSIQTDEGKQKVVENDRALLKSFGEGKVDEMANQLAWTQNQTRWPAVGAMVAAHRIAGGGEVKMLNYAAAADQQGVSMVSTFSAAMV